VGETVESVTRSKPRTPTHPLAPSLEGRGKQTQHSPTVQPDVVYKAASRPCIGPSVSPRRPVNPAPPRHSRAGGNPAGTHCSPGLAGHAHHARVATVRERHQKRHRLLTRAARRCRLISACSSTLAHQEKKNTAAGNQRRCQMLWSHPAPPNGGDKTDFRSWSISDDDGRPDRQGRGGPGRRGRG
jgi:hypothetical protein